MLGKFVKVHVTAPMYSYNKRFGFKYQLNYGIVENARCSARILWESVTRFAILTDG